MSKQRADQMRREPDWRRSTAGFGAISGRPQSFDGGRGSYAGGAARWGPRC